MGDLSTISGFDYSNRDAGKQGKFAGLTPG